MISNAVIKQMVDKAYLNLMNKVLPSGRQIRDNVEAMPADQQEILRAVFQDGYLTGIHDGMGILQTIRKTPQE